MVCRLKYRKGEPLQLAIYPAPTFVPLLLEIQIKIYRLLLISSEPITVYTERRYLPAERQPYGTYPKVAAVTFALLRVNRRVSTEAAAVFYHHDVFKFDGSQQ